MSAVFTVKSTIDIDTNINGLTNHFELNYRSKTTIEAINKFVVSMNVYNEKKELTIEDMIAINDSCIELIESLLGVGTVKQIFGDDFDITHEMLENLVYFLMNEIGKAKESTVKKYGI